MQSYPEPVLATAAALDEMAAIWLAEAAAFFDRFGADVLADAFLVQVREHRTRAIQLWALDATIEAGRGFRVVAAEVKALASQTARATDEIAGKIDRIQPETPHTVSAIAIGLAAAMEEQDVVIQEIARGIGARQPGRRPCPSTSPTCGWDHETGKASQKALSAALDLAGRAEEFDRTVNAFLSDVKAA